MIIRSLASENEELPIQPTQNEDCPPDDAIFWAQDVSSLRLSHVPTGALNLNVEGRGVMNPLQGFGQLWQKTFRIALPGVQLTPTEVVTIWKAHFTEFQPAQNRFFVEGKKIEPGRIMLINASLGGMPVSTGMVVLYSDDISFTLMTPQGHPESGWVTFSAEMEADTLVCQVQTMSRSNDPLNEIVFRIFASKAQDRIWTHVLEALAAHIQVAGQQVQVAKVCIDPRVQWSEVKNIWHNAALLTLLYILAAPLRWISHLRLSKREHKKQG